MATVKLIWRGGLGGRPGWFLQSDYPQSLRQRLRKHGIADVVETRPGVFWIPANEEHKLIAAEPAVALHAAAPALL